MDRVDYETHVIQDIYNFFKSDELKLDPWYQRRSVWSRTQQSYLINTLFVKKPIPTLYLRHYLDIDKEKSIKEVVDGQQRLRAIIEYLAGEFAAKHPAHSGTVNYSQLTAKEKTDFKMTKLSVGSLVDASESDVIEIFGRLNSVSKTLNAQEKRNAQHSGLFKQFCLMNAAKKVMYWRETNIFTANNIARMDEVQFISDISLNLINGLSDFSASKLDALYKNYDDEFATEEELQAKIDNVFSILDSVGIETIRNTIFSRSPIFFSLFLVLNENKNISKKKLSEQLLNIDAIFNDSDTHNDVDSKFHAACTASTQRIANRKVRHQYLLDHLV